MNIAKTRGFEVEVFWRTRGIRQQRGGSGGENGEQPEAQGFRLKGVGAKTESSLELKDSG